MGVIPQVSPLIQKTLAVASRCAEAETSENYADLEDRVGDLESGARQAFQAKVDIASLLPKLEKGQRLMPTDLKALELLIVGDDLRDRVPLHIRFHLRDVDSKVPSGFVEKWLTFVNQLVLIGEDLLAP